MAAAKPGALREIPEASRGDRPAATLQGASSPDLRLKFMLAPARIRLPRAAFSCVVGSREGRFFLKLSREQARHEANYGDHFKEVMQLTSVDSRPLRCGSALVAGMLLAPAAQAADRLELMPDPIVTAVLLTAFILVIFPLNRLIFQPLMKVMDEREERIDGARARAAEVEQQAEDALNRYRETLRDAHAQAAGQRRVRVNEAREQLLVVTGQAKEEAELELTRARETLSASLDEAKGSLRDAAGELASLAAERILGRSLTG